MIFRGTVIRFWVRVAGLVGADHGGRCQGPPSRAERGDRVAPGHCGPPPIARVDWSRSRALTSGMPHSQGHGSGQTSPHKAPRDTGCKTNSKVDAGSTQDFKSCQQTFGLESPDRARGGVVSTEGLVRSTAEDLTSLQVSVSTGTTTPQPTPAVTGKLPAFRPCRSAQARLLPDATGAKPFSTGDGFRR